MDFAINAGQPSAADAAAKSIGDNCENFLLLLTTQLTNQDPLEPLNANEFTAQLVRFTQVEQSIAANKHMEELVALFEAGRAHAAVGYIGKTVEGSGGQNQLTADGAVWTYTLPMAAVNSTLAIKNAAGSIVYTAEGEVDAGKHTLQWDGKDAQGVQLAEGVYTFAVSAKDAQGGFINTATGVVGIVTGVETVACWPSAEHWCQSTALPPSPKARTGRRTTMYKRRERNLDSPTGDFGGKER